MPCAEKLRVACSLGGAYTALSIDGVLPVLHSGPGCLGQTRQVLAASNGGQSTLPFSESIVPCSDFTESQVVFGGTDNLRKVIGQSLDAYKADALVVLEGCTPAIIGDDVEQVVSDFSDARVPVLFASTVGFKGSNLQGHDAVLRSLIDGLLKDPVGRSTKQVNILGIVPYYDAFWEGSLEALGDLLGEIGLEPNILYGLNHGLEDFRKIPEAAFNLVVAPWTDLGIAQYLEEKFETPYFHQTHLPIGPTETTKFLRNVADFAKLDRNLVESVIAREEKRYYHYVQKALPWIYRCKAVPKEFFLLGGSSTALAVTKFLVNDVGLLPRGVYVTEEIPDDHRQRVVELFHDLEAVTDFEVIVGNDGGLFHATATEETVRGRPAIFGSLQDELYAKQNLLPFVAVSTPLGNNLVGDGHYFGYRGATRLFHEFYSASAGSQVNL